MLEGRDAHIGEVAAALEDLLTGPPSRAFAVTGLGADLIPHVLAAEAREAVRVLFAWGPEAPWLRLGGSSPSSSAVACFGPPGRRRRLSRGVHGS